MDSFKYTLKMKICDCNEKEKVAKRYLSKIIRDRYKERNGEKIKAYSREYTLKYYHEKISHVNKKKTLMKKLEKYNIDYKQNMKII